MGSALNWKLNRIKVKSVGDGDLPLKEVVTVPVSFETVGIGQMRVYFPFAVTINKIRSCVTIALAAASDGFITCGNATGASTNGVVSIAASEGIGGLDSASPTTNNTVAKDSYYYLTSSKANVGGEAFATLEYTRSV
jgi:hypothetical protein